MAKGQKNSFVVGAVVALVGVIVGSISTVAVTASMVRRPGYDPNAVLDGTVIGRPTTVEDLSNKYDVLRRVNATDIGGPRDYSQAYDVEEDVPYVSPDSVQTLTLRCHDIGLTQTRLVRCLGQAREGVRYDPQAG